MKWLLIAAIVSVSFPDEPSEDSREESSSMREEIEREATFGQNFPTGPEIYTALWKINDDFLKSAPGHDNWCGFYPLMERVVKFQAAVSNAHEKMRIESEILDRFNLYSFACEYDHDPIKANFDSRLKSLDLLCGFDLVMSNTNSLMSIADWLAGARQIIIDEDTLSQRYLEAWRIDRLAIFGGKIPPRYPGSQRGHREVPPNVRMSVARSDFRRVYNRRLPDFRAKAEARMRKFVFEEFKAKDEQERKALWAEFCRRAKFTTP